MTYRTPWKNRPGLCSAAESAEKKQNRESRAGKGWGVDCRGGAWRGYFMWFCGAGLSPVGGFWEGVIGWISEN